MRDCKFIQLKRHLLPIRDSFGSGDFRIDDREQSPALSMLEYEGWLPLFTFIKNMFATLALESLRRCGELAYPIV